MSDADQNELELNPDDLWEVRQYLTPDGRKIIEMKPTPESKLNLVYKGACMVLTPGGPAEMNFPIIGAETLQQAVEMFADAAQDAEKKAREAQQQPRIAVPRGPGPQMPPNMPPGGLIVPG